VNVGRSASEVGRLGSDEGRMNWECVLKIAMYPTSASSVSHRTSSADYRRGADVFYGRHVGNPAFNCSASALIHMVAASSASHRTSSADYRKGVDVFYGRHVSDPAFNYCASALIHMGRQFSICRSHMQHLNTMCPSLTCSASHHTSSADHRKGFDVSTAIM
jgi:hypothetical protein